MLQRKARITKATARKLLRFFAEDVSATTTAKLVGVNRNTVNLWYTNFREQIAAYQEVVLGKMSGEIELDESYFGGLRKKRHAEDRRKRGRGTENKVPVFGIKKREEGTVYTQIIKTPLNKSFCSSFGS